MRESNTNVKNRKRSRVLTPEQVEWAYDKWCEGYPLQEIADKLHVAPSVIYKAFNGRKRSRPPLEAPPKAQ